MTKVEEGPDIVRWPGATDKRRRDAVEPPRPSDRLTLDLPFGEMHLHEFVATGGARFQMKAILTTEIEYRLAHLCRSPQLVPVARAIRELAVTREQAGKSYLCDWELRARLAEAELAALFIEAKKLPKRIRRAQAVKNAFTRHHDTPMQRIKGEIYPQWQEWRSKKKIAKGKNRAADFLREMADAYPDVQLKTLENWHAKWKKMESQDVESLK